MVRLALVSALLILTLSACGESGQREDRAPGQAMDTGLMREGLATEASEPGENAPKLAYSHNMALEMAADAVQPRFERARSACLTDATLGCSLVEASINVGDANTGVPPRATLTVRLPHNQIAAFEKNLFALLPNERAGEPLMRQRSTAAEDLTFAIADNDRRLAQATDYRDRLMALSQRAEAKIEDLIKIEQQISEVQSQIEAMTAAQRGLNLRVDTEILTVTLDAHPTFDVASSPLAEAWRESGRMLGESAATAFTFLVTLLPWLPLIALLAYVLMRLWRGARRHRTGAARAMPDAAGTSN